MRWKVARNIYIMQLIGTPRKEKIAIAIMPANIGHIVVQSKRPTVEIKLCNNSIYTSIYFVGSLLKSNIK